MRFLHSVMEEIQTVFRVKDQETNRRKLRLSEENKRILCKQQRTRYPNKNSKMQGITGDADWCAIVLSFR